MSFISILAERRDPGSALVQVAPFANVNDFPAGTTVVRTVDLGVPTLLNAQTFGASEVEIVDTIALVADTYTGNAQTFGAATIELGFSLGVPTLINAQTFGASEVLIIDPPMEIDQTVTFANTQGFGASTVALTDPVSYTLWSVEDKGASCVLTNGRLTATQSAASDSWHSVRAQEPKNSGKWYFEITCVDNGGTVGGFLPGVANIAAQLFNYFGKDNNAHVYIDDGRYLTNDINTGFGSHAAFGNGDVIGIAVDVDAREIWYRVNGADWNDDVAHDPATGVGGVDISNVTGALYPCCGLFYTGAQAIGNFGDTFVDSAPSGFEPWSVEQDDPFETAMRYFRLFIETTNGHTHGSISELIPRLVSGGANQATGGTPSQSSTPFPLEPASNAFDGDVSTPAAVGPVTATSNEWFQYDFGAGNEKLIQDVGISARTDAFADSLPNDFRFLVSPDEIHWQVVKRVIDQSGWVLGSTRDFDLTPEKDQVQTTQIALEVLRGPSVSIRTSQIALEILYGWPPPDPPAVPPDEPLDPEDPDYPGEIIIQAWDRSTAGVTYHADISRVGLIVRRVQPTTPSGSIDKCVYGINPLYGKRTWIIECRDTVTGSSTGLGSKQSSVHLDDPLGESAQSIGYRTDGVIRLGGADHATGFPTYGNGDEVMVAFDALTRQVWFGLNGTWQGDPGAGTGEAAIMPAAYYYPMDHVIDQPHYKYGNFSGNSYHSPNATNPSDPPPTGFKYFDPGWEH